MYSGQITAEFNADTVTEDELVQAITGQHKPASETSWQAAGV
jgi:hypothetical protein